MREKLSSRIGFIFLSAGCAIGLGNVWRFPYVAGKSGGGWFVLFYLVSLALLGIPILAMEFAAGRAAQRSIAKMHSALVPEKRAWRLHGVAGFVGNLVLMMFYTVVTGWMLIYFCRMAAGRFDGLDTAGIGAAFNAMLGDPVAMGTAAVVVTAMAAAVCSIGLQKGVERVSKVMMGMLLALIVVLAVRSVLLPGAGKGVAFYLVPDFAKVREIGVGNVFVEAMNVAALDTSVALAAGLIVIPACFAFGIEPAQGPGLVFVTLPNVFNSMPLGRLWGSLFFAFMGFAALTTVLAVFENVVACIMDYFGLGRRGACAAAALLISVLSMPCVLGFNVWSSFEPFGKGTCVLDLEDFVVSDILLPLGSLAFAVFCTRRYGWGWKNFLAEVNAGEGWPFPARLRLYCAYGIPLIILSLFVTGLLRRFG